MQALELRRTPPGVRELKLDMLGYGFEITISRTPPGVRELKQWRPDESNR